MIGDIDIDLADRNAALEGLDHRVASINHQGARKRHNTGVYFQTIPIAVEDQLAVVDYKSASNLGYYKIDFLNVHIYNQIKNEQHLLKLMNTPPKWELFEYAEITDKLFHLNGHSDVCKKIKPQSVEDLAMVLALIRPGKRHLLAKSKDEILKEIWEPPANNEYHFKKSHSISYAVAIIVHLNLITEQAELSFNN